MKIQREFQGRADSANFKRRDWLYVRVISLFGFYQNGKIKFHFRYSYFHDVFITYIQYVCAED